MTSHSRITLASTSPRRMTLLNQLGLDFTVTPPTEDESSVHTDPAQRVMENASTKARSVASGTESEYVLGADTLVYLDDVVIGKPKDMEDARRMLETLQGRVHKVYTGVSLIRRSDGLELTGSEETLVHMKKLTPEQIQAYLDTGEPMGKAGAYAIQGFGGAFVDRVVGSFHNVIGLPLSLVWDMFNEMGEDLMKHVKP